MYKRHSPWQVWASEVLCVLQTIHGDFGEAVSGILSTIMTTWINCGANVGTPQAGSLLPGFHLHVWNWLDIAFCSQIRLLGFHLMY